MLKSIHFTKIFLSIVFLFALSLTSYSQITLINNTDCPMQAKAGQEEGCSICNPSPVFSLAQNGGMETHDYDQNCDRWIAAKFNVGAPILSPNPTFTSSGETYNPAVLCGGIDVPATCNGTTVTATWQTFGTFARVTFTN